VWFVDVLVRNVRNHGTMTREFSLSKNTKLSASSFAPPNSSKNHHRQRSASRPSSSSNPHTMSLASIFVAHYRASMLHVAATVSDILLPSECVWALMVLSLVLTNFNSFVVWLTQPGLGQRCVSALLIAWFIASPMIIAHLRDSRPSSHWGLESNL
jgi:hypothetical protein